MANNKVQLADGTTLIDLTEDTVTPQTMLSGTTAHAASGEQITGVVDLALAGSTIPEAEIYDGLVGSSENYAREDHAHPIPAWLIPRIITNDLDLNTLSRASFRVIHCGTGCTNGPYSGAAWYMLLHAGSAQGGGFQIAVISGTGHTYSRSYTGINGWSNWIRIDNLAEEIERKAADAAVEEIIAPVLSSMVADTNLVAGDLRIYNSELYRITSNISSGSNIVVGTNAVKIDISGINESGNGYCKLPDGTMFQWGVGSLNATSGQSNYGTIVFPKEFATQYPDVFLNPLTADATIRALISDRTATDATAYIFTTASTRTVWFSWFAIGRWK